MCQRHIPIGFISKKMLAKKCKLKNANFQTKFSYITYYSVANCKNGCYITFHIICFIIYLPLFVCACYEPVGAIKLCKSKTTTCKLLCIMNFEMDFGENQFQNFRFQNFSLANLVYLFSS